MRGKARAGPDPSKREKIKINAKSTTNGPALVRERTGPKTPGRVAWFKRTKASKSKQGGTH